MKSDDELSFDFERFNLRAGKQFEVLSCPSLIRDDKCPYSNETVANQESQNELKTQLAALKASCSADGLVIIRKMYALYREHETLDENSSNDQRCSVSTDRKSSSSDADEQSKKIAECESTLAGGADYVVLRCKTFDASQKPPKPVLDSTFTIDKIGHRYRILDKLHDFNWQKKERADPDGFAYELGDDKQWYDADFNGEELSVDLGDAGFINLDMASGTGEYVGYDATLQYQCKR